MHDQFSLIDTKIDLIRKDCFKNVKKSEVKNVVKLNKQIENLQESKKLIEHEYSGKIKKEEKAKQEIIDEYNELSKNKNQSVRQLTIKKDDANSNGDIHASKKISSITKDIHKKIKEDIKFIKAT